MATNIEKDIHEDESEIGGEMTFLDHLEALRWHLIRAVGSIVVFGLVAFINISWIYRNVILAPTRTDFWTYRMLCKLGDAVGAADLCVKKIEFVMISIAPAAQFTMAITSSIIIGLLFAFPYAFWEIWRFVKPGLYATEKRATNGAVFYVATLFLTGVLFGYYVVSPLAINFLANYQLDPSIKNQFTIDSYISLLATLTLACGVTFQLPIVAFFLSKAGILTPSFMREYRKHAFVVVLVVAAIITPSPDITSQVMVSLPLVLLYEVSIVVSGRVERQRLRELR